MRAIRKETTVKRAIHYMNMDETRWRRGGWLVLHGAHSPVCMGGPMHSGVTATYNRRIVTCKRCLAIIPAIDTYRASESEETAN